MRLDASSISSLLIASRRISDRLLIEALRSSCGPASTVRGLFAEAQSSRLGELLGIDRRKSTTLMRRRGIALGLLQDRPHMIFPLTPIGHHVACLVAAAAHQKVAS